jgi:hypothetical protein
MDKESHSSPANTGYRKRRFLLLIITLVVVLAAAAVTFFVQTRSNGLHKGYGALDGKRLGLSQIPTGPSGADLSKLAQQQAFPGHIELKAVGDTNSSQSRSLQTDANGKFLVELLPGQYQISGGEADGCTGETVNIVADVTVQADVSCQK